MPTIAVSDQLHYFYTDSGVPHGAVSDYHTLILIHGHSFHSGTFQRLLPIAPSKNMRLICINRREYPGTTPFSDSENKVIISGNDQERFGLLQDQGVGLAKFVCGVIEQCAIPAPAPVPPRGLGDKTKKGGITVGGWSLGNIYMLSLAACVDVLEYEVREKLQAYVTGFLMWDLPCQTVGAPEPPKSYVPLWDQSVEPEDRRGSIFEKWISSYYKHGNDPTHNLDSLLYHWESADPSKKCTLETISQEDLASMMDATAGDPYDTKMIEAEFLSVTNKQMMKALFDRNVRKLWKDTGFYHLYGDESVWNVIYGAWYIQDKAKELSADCEEEFTIRTCVQEGANHFPMWEDPEKAWDAIIECISG